MTDRRIVMATAASKEEAQTIAQALVDRRLAACVNILGPMQSIYRWKGAVEESNEWLLIVKTTATMTAQVDALVRTLHSYEVPEVIVLPLESGSEPYLRWIGESVGPESQ